MSFSNFKLYEISNQYQNAIDDLLRNEDSETLIFDQIKSSFDDKCINVGYAIKNIEAEYNAVKIEIDNMQKRLQSIEKEYNKLNSYLKAQIEACGLLDPIKCAKFEIKLKSNPPSLLIEDERLIPDIYMKIKEVKSFDKNAMKKDILDGFEVEGARIVRTKRLEIK